MTDFSATDVRYIKLGSGGQWEERCLFRDHTIMLGYENPYHSESLAGNWETVRAYWLAHRNDEGAATRDVNQIRDFYEMPESCLWITFHARQLYWCFASSEVTELDDGTRIRRVKGKWSSKSLKSEALYIENLDGRVTKVQGYRGTICSVERSDYLIRKIKGEAQPDVQEAQARYQALLLSLEALIVGLWWKDFELLVDLVFSQSGWQRVSTLGKTEKHIDLDLLFPVTGKRAFVQVKSHATISTLEDSIIAYRSMSQFNEMYFVVHTSDEQVSRYSGESISVIDVKRLAELVVSAGLVNWLITKRS